MKSAPNPWSSMDPDERNLRLEFLHRRAAAAFIAIFMGALFTMGALPAMFLGGIASSLVHVVLHRQMTRELEQGCA